MIHVGDKVRWQGGGAEYIVKFVENEGVNRFLWLIASHKSYAEAYRAFASECNPIPHVWRIGDRCNWASEARVPALGTVVGVHRKWIFVVTDGSHDVPYAYEDTSWVYIGG